MKYKVFLSILVFVLTGCLPKSMNLSSSRLASFAIGESDYKLIQENFNAASIGGMLFCEGGKITLASQQKSIAASQDKKTGFLSLFFLTPDTADGKKCYVQISGIPKESAKVVWLAKKDRQELKDLLYISSEEIMPAAQKGYSSFEADFVRTFKIAAQASAPPTENNTIEMTGDPKPESDPKPLKTQVPGGGDEVEMTGDPKPTGSP